MEILMVIGCILFLIVLLLYVNCLKDLHTLRNQLRYAREQESHLEFYTTSANREMKRIAQELNLIQDRLQRSKGEYVLNEQHMKELVTNISHDIRTPLTSIEGYMEMMTATDSVSDKERYASIIRQRLQELETMLDEFFVYSCIMSQQEALQLEEQPLYPLVCSCLLSYYEELSAAGLQPEVCCSDESCMAMLQEEALRRICRNLIVNVLRYGKAPFQIDIYKKQGKAILCFHNRLASTEAVQIDELFQRFYKGTTSRGTKGSGLGLAIVQELVQQMHGEIQASQEEDMLSICITFA